MGITVGKSYDLNAAEFFNATQILTPVQKQAVNGLVVDLKNYSIWNSMKAVYPFVGQAGVSSSFSYNLKNPNTFRGIFSGSWTFSSTGVTPDGESAYMDTNFTPSLELSLDSVHACQYFNEGSNLTLTATWEFGARVTGVGDFSCAWRYDDSFSYLRISTLGNQFSSALASNSGFRLASRTSSTLTKAYVNNTNNYSDVTISTGLPTIPLYIGARNNNGTPFNFSNRRQSFTSFGDGLTDTQAANLYTAVQRFQTTLGRQV
jgi:hypothetical protein